jgi:hypothetical protein
MLSSEFCVTCSKAECEYKHETYCEWHTWWKLFHSLICAYVATHICTLLTCIYGLFNNAVTSSDYIASNGRMISEQ